MKQVLFSTLLHSKGLDISEPMAFGLASALAFVYLPIVKTRWVTADCLSYAAKNHY